MRYKLNQFIGKKSPIVLRELWDENLEFRKKSDLGKVNSELSQN